MSNTKKTTSYKFEIKFIVGEDENKTEIKPYKLLSFVKENDFYKNFVPLITIKVLIETEYVRKIYFSQSTVFCNIIVYRLDYDSDIDFQNDKPSKTTKDYEHNYLCMFNSNSFEPEYSKGSNYQNPDTPADAVKTINPEDEATTFDSYSRIICNLFELDDRRFSKMISSNLFKDSKVSTSIVYVVQELVKRFGDLKRGMLLDKCDNPIKFGYIWVLPGNIKQNILQIQSVYGIYANGVIVYLDHGLLYVLKKNTAIHATFNNSSNLTEIKLDDDASAIKFPFQYIENDDNSYVFETSTNLKKVNKDVGFSELFGDNIMFSNASLILDSVTTKDGEIDSFKEPVMILNKQSAGNIHSGTKTSVFYDSLNNPYNYYEYMKDMSISEVINLTVNGCIPSAFDPNRYIKLTINKDDDKNNMYGGDYCIRSTTFTYLPMNNTASPNDSFITSCSVGLVLSKS